MPVRLGQLRFDDVHRMVRMVRKGADALRGFVGAAVGEDDDFEDVRGDRRAVDLSLIVERGEGLLDARGFVTRRDRNRHSQTLLRAGQIARTIEIEFVHARCSRSSR